MLLWGNWGKLNRSLVVKEIFSRRWKCQDFSCVFQSCTLIQHKCFYSHWIVTLRCFKWVSMRFHNPRLSQPALVPHSIASYFWHSAQSGWMEQFVDFSNHHFLNWCITLIPTSSFAQAMSDFFHEGPLLSQPTMIPRRGSKHALHPSYWSDCSKFSQAENLKWFGK